MKILYYSQDWITMMKIDAFKDNQNLMILRTNSLKILNPGSNFTKHVWKKERYVTIKAITEW